MALVTLALRPGEDTNLRVQWLERTALMSSLP